MKEEQYKELETRVKELVMDKKKKRRKKKKAAKAGSETLTLKKSDIQGK